MRIKLSIIGICVLLLLCVYIEAFASDEPINEQGGINAGWVLTGAFIIIGSLIAFIVYDIKKQFSVAMGAVITKLESHDKDLKEHSILHGRYEEKFKTLFKK